MLLIADSGSTKTDWVLIDDKKHKKHYSTMGYNPNFIDTENILLDLSQKLIPKLNATSVKKIFFYGADCSTPKNNAVVHKALSLCFTKAQVHVGHDMLAAAHSLLGNKRGFAAIIGTGSNTCVYDGSKIEKTIPPLGYLLGDEGSGSYIGKMILRDYMRGYLSKQLEKKFKKVYPIKVEEIFDAMYNQPYPNRFLSGFCKFAHKHKKEKYIKNIIKESFNDFFKNLVNRYPECREFSFNCAGSVGFIFKDLLTEVARSYKMKIGKIIPSPIDGLVDYHLKVK